MHDLLEIAGKILLLGTLSFNAFTDIREQRVSGISMILGAMNGVVIRCLDWRNFSSEILLGFIPGLVCILVSVCSRQAIGMGDAFLILLMGMFLSVDMVLSACYLAFFLAGFLVLLFGRTWKKRGQKEIPFVPFLLMGYVISQI